MTPWYRDWGVRVAVCYALIVLGIIFALISHAAAEPPPPYSCRLLYDEQRKAAYGGGDKRIIERLTRECLRDGGRP
jgi:hypothetical protein